MAGEGTELSTFPRLERFPMKQCSYVCGLILLAASLASAQETIKAKTDLQGCQEDLAVEQKVAVGLYDLLQQSAPQPKSESLEELQKKYDALVAKFNANVAQHNQLVKQYDELYDVAMKVATQPQAAPRSRASAFMQGFSRSMAAQRQANSEQITCNTTSFGNMSSTNCY